MDNHDLNRFVTAQENAYETVLAELRAGEKLTHWMWFIFPQIEGLGRSETARFYAIKSREEAATYLRHEVLGRRLIECSEIVLATDDRSAREIFGSTDEMKLRSCMTLFSQIAGAGSVFHRVLDKYFDGRPDKFTIDLLNRMAARRPA